MAYVYLFRYFVFLVCSILLVLSKSYAATLNTNGGFSISLIHHDSPQSPFYNHSMTTYERRAAAARRSINRLHHLMSLSSAYATTFDYDVSTKVVRDNSEYIATIYIGNPETQLRVIVDTGSGRNWVKGGPIYDPKKSLTYRERYCTYDGTCPYRSTCNHASSLCSYMVTYGDGSTSSGIVSYEDFVLDDPSGKVMVSVGNIQFGFATEAIGFKQSENGLLGLNREPYSFISQLDIRKFSHCFAIMDDQGSGNRMYFGPSAVISNITTPIEPSMDHAYYVTLLGISIGDNLVEMPPGVFALNKTSLEGGVILDIGASFTILRYEAYNPFISKMRQQVNKPSVYPFKPYDFCFRGTIADLHSLPDVTFHFVGVDYTLPKYSTYVDAADGVWCLAILPQYSYQISAIGNLQLRNVQVGYDLERQKISILAADCTAS